MKDSKGWGRDVKCVKMMLSGLFLKKLVFSSWLLVKENTSKSNKAKTRLNIVLNHKLLFCCNDSRVNYNTIQ